MLYEAEYVSAYRGRLFRTGVEIVSRMVGGKKDNDAPVSPDGKPADQVGDGLAQLAAFSAASTL